MPVRKRTAWFAMFDGVSTLLEVMDSDLRRDCGVPLAWYDLMIKLCVAPGRQLRMSELAQRTHLSRSWLTRRVKQLEDQGLVERCGDDVDGRGVLAVMTACGVEQFEAWEASHAQTIATYFSTRVTTAQAEVLATVGFELHEHALAELQRRGER